MATVLRFPYTARSTLPAYGSAAVGGARSRALLALAASAVFHIVVLAAIAAVTRDRVPAWTSPAPTPAIMQVALPSAPSPSTASVLPQAPFRPGEGVKRSVLETRRVLSGMRAKALAVPAAMPEPMALVTANPGNTGLQRLDENIAVAGASVRSPTAAAIGTEIPAMRSAPASYSHSPKPEYPLAAREDGQEGVVVLRVRVSSQGLPTEVRVDRSSGFSLLDRAAISAVRHWTFNPAMADARPIESWMEVPIRFRLGDP